MKETPLPKCMQFAIIMQNDAKMEIKKTSNVSTVAWGSKTYTNNMFQKLTLCD